MTNNFSLLIVKTRMKKIPALILIIFIFFFVFEKSVSAAVLFEDNFNDGNANGWVVLGLSNWNVTNDEYGIHVNSGVSNSVPEDGLWNNNWVNYIYKVDLRGVYGTDKNIIFRFQNTVNFYEIHHTQGNIYFEKEIGGTRYSFGSVYYPLSNGPTYHFEIKIIGSHFEIYENGNLLFNVNDSGPSLEFGKIGFRVGTGAVSPSEVWYDNVLVTSIEPSPTPTPTLQPLILLPGLGASWNHGAMISDNPVSPEDWYMTPGVKNYDGIIQTFKNAGYVEDDNLFVFNYDWRKPIEEIADDLNDYIDNVIDPPPEEEIDLVGHSLGGMVARTYVQNNPTNHQVNQLITLGSPHHGAPQAYCLWEGADLNKTLSEAWQRIGAGILIHLKRTGGETKVEAVRRIVKVLKDLLPTLNYLKQDGEVKTIEEMSQKNDWLATLNSSLPEDLTSRLTTILGKKGDTLRWINIKPRSKVDIILGRWEDGKPIGEEFEIGDGSVLVESGQLESASLIEINNANHGDLVESGAGQEKIVDLLDLSPSEIVPAPKITFEPMLIFQLASPANMTVYGPNNWQIGDKVDNNIPNSTYSPKDQLIIIPQAIEGNYKITVSAMDGGGAYQLLVGLLTEKGDFWKEFKDNVSAGSTNIHNFWFPSSEQIESFLLLNQAKTQVSDLKKYLNKLKVSSRFRGKIISKLAVCMGNINAALNLLEEGNNEATNDKIEKAILKITELEEFVDEIKDKEVKQFLKEFLSEPLDELKDLLLQAELIN